MWRAFMALLALAALVAAIYPDVLLPMLIQRGFVTTAPTQENLQMARYAIGTVAVIILLLCLGRPLASDFRTYRRRLKLARDEGADASRIMAEIEGRGSTLGLTLVLLGFIAYAFAARDDLVDRLLAPNSLADTATAIFYVMAVVLTIFEVVRQTGARQRIGLQRWLLVTVAAIFVLIAGEELDWARPNVPPPGAGAEAGMPEETLSPLQRIPLPTVTEEGTWTTQVYGGDALLRILSALLGIALPLLMLAFPSFARWLWASGIPVPSRIVQLGFAVAALLPSDVTFGGWFGRENAISEMRELLCGGMFLLLIWQTVRSNCVDEPRPSTFARL